MDTRKKFRALMAGKRLVLMPGAYDALSARIIEAEGFEAIVAGGYAAIGSMLAQADMGQSNMRDYADHYARICDAVQIPVYVDADTGFGGVNNVRQMVRAFEAAARHASFTHAAEELHVTQAAWSHAEPARVLANAVPYMQAFGHVVLAWIWLDVAQSDGANDILSQGRKAACRFFFRYELPKIDAWLGVVSTGDNVFGELPEEAF